jgi:hypothetical protein
LTFGTKPETTTNHSSAASQGPVRSTMEVFSVKLVQKDNDEYFTWNSGVLGESELP